MRTLIIKEGCWLEDGVEIPNWSVYQVLNGIETFVRMFSTHVDALAFVQDAQFR